MINNDGFNTVKSIAHGCLPIFNLAHERPESGRLLPYKIAENQLNSGITIMS
jgi:hypothetical protein